MTYAIDPSTGLPVLPANQFWRIVRVVDTDFIEWHGNGPTNSVQLIEKSTETKEFPLPKRAFRKQEYETRELHVEKVIDTKYVGEFLQLQGIEENYSEEAVATIVKANKKARKKFLAAHPDAKDGQTWLYRWTSDGYIYYGGGYPRPQRKTFVGVTNYLGVNEVTPATIEAAAVKILDGLEAERVKEIRKEEERIQREIDDARARLEHEKRELELNRFVGDYPPRVLAE